MISYRKKIALKTSMFLCMLLFIFTTSCKKEAGEGGNCSIRGKIWVKDYNNNFTVLHAEYPGADVDVYIIYGTDISYGDKIKTSPDGQFEFKYLRKGNYTVYVYSKNKKLVPPTYITVEVKTVVSKNNEQVDVGTIEIDD